MSTPPSDSVPPLPPAAPAANALEFLEQFWETIAAMERLTSRNDPSLRGVRRRSQHPIEHAAELLLVAATPSEVGHTRRVLALFTELLRREASDDVL